MVGHGRERRRLRRTEQRGRRQRIAQQALQRRAGQAEDAADRQRQDRPRQPQLQHDDALGLRAAAGQGGEDMVGGDRHRPGAERKDEQHGGQRRQHRHRGAGTPGSARKVGRRGRPGSGERVMHGRLIDRMATGVDHIGFRGGHFVTPETASPKILVEKGDFRRAARQTPALEAGFRGAHPFQATSTAPSAIKATPSQLVHDNRSPSSTAPNTATSTTLSLSIGATRAASPSFSAWK